MLLTGGAWDGVRRDSPCASLGSSTFVRGSTRVASLLMWSMK